jgi:hypothetical protein
MDIKLFGFKLVKDTKEDTANLQNFTPPEEFDGAYTLEGSGVYGTFIDFMGSAKDEQATISQYRAMALYPEVDTAIDEITNEAIVSGNDRKPIKLDLSKINFSENIKSKIYSEFDSILQLLDFQDKCYEIFRRWYIDSKLYFYISIDMDDPSAGIKQLVPLDSTKIKKVRKIKSNPAKQTGNSLSIIQDVDEFYVYSNNDKNSVIGTGAAGLRISPDSICYVHSGMVDMNSKRVLGFLHKAIRPLNMLRQVEDAIVVYRISRAPERRIFYVDVGNLPKQKAEQYVRELMNKYRNRMIYNQTTGEIKDDRNQMAMLEDFWLPRREGGRGTEITTLDGGQNLGELTDVEYFKKKLYFALNIPPSRLVSENGFNMGRSADITRDEVKFYKFIERLRYKFSGMFSQLLKVQLILKGVITEDDWNLIYPHINFSFNRDSYFNDLKDAEILSSRMELAAQMEPMIGRYYSSNYIRKNILKQSEEEMELIDREMAVDIAKRKQEELEQLQLQQAMQAQE